MNNDTMLLFDFGQNKQGQDWRIINDTVMGGKSEAIVSFTSNTAILQGNLSLENNGGFSSFRSQFDDYDLSAYTHLKIRYNSHGRTFGIMLETSKFFFRPHYKYEINSGNKWETLTIPIKEFKQYRLGESTGEKIKENTFDDIIRIGCILLDKKQGEFKLEIDTIAFF